MNTQADIHVISLALITDMHILNCLNRLAQSVHFVASRILRTRCGSALIWCGTSVEYSYLDLWIQIARNILFLDPTKSGPDLSRVGPHQCSTELALPYTSSHLQFIASANSGVQDVWCCLTHAVHSLFVFAGCERTSTSPIVATTTTPDLG